MTPEQYQILFSKLSTMTSSLAPDMHSNTPTPAPSNDSLSPYRHYPHHTFYASVMNGCITKVTFDELMQQGPEAALRLKRSILRTLKQLAQSPIDEIEMLMIILAYHDFNDVVRLKWRRTERGQAVKEQWVAARRSAVRFGILEVAGSRQGGEQREEGGGQMSGI